MSVELHNLGWLELNSQRSYPLSETATGKDTTNTFELPDSFLVALYVTLDARIQPDPLSFFVSQIVNSPGAVVGVISYWNGTTAEVVGTFAVPSVTHTEFNPYQLTMSTNWSGSTARAVVGDLTEIGTLPVGTFNFDITGGRLDTDCIRPSLRGISDIVLVDGNERSEPITGRVTFIAGSNFRFGLIRSEGNTVIRFDAVNGEGLFTDCGCADDDALAPCIRTVSGVAAGTDGNIDLVGNSCIDVTVSGAGLLLSDTCAKPCCGSSELNAIVTDLQRISSQQVSLSNFVNRLETVINGLNMVVLASRLGDGGCTT